MDIMTLLVNLVSGAVGGNIAGASFKDKSLGTLGNTLAGLVGGTAGTYILQAVNLLSSVGLSDMSVGQIAGNIGSSAVIGGIVTFVLGMIKNSMSKS